MCDQPLSILVGFVLSVLIDTESRNRIAIHGHMDGKNVEWKEDGSVEVFDPVEQFVFPDGEVVDADEIPSWFRTTNTMSGINLDANGL